MIGEDLHLDVARAIDAVRRTGSRRRNAAIAFAPRRLNGLGRLRPIADLAHPLAAAAGRR